VHNRSRQPRYCLLIAWCIAFLAACQAQAWTYHSFTNGYALNFPDDWQQIPDEILAMQSPSLPALRTAGAFDVAFQPKHAGRWFEYPFIVVEVVPYSAIGKTTQLASRDMLEIVKTNTGVDPATSISAETESMEGGGELDAPDGTVHFDPSRHRFLWSSASKVDRVGLIQARQWGFFGKEAFVNVTLYELGNGSPRLHDMARCIAATFKFEVGKSYQAGITAADIASVVKDSMFQLSPGVIAAGLCIVVAVICALAAMRYRGGAPLASIANVRRHNRYR
jgi:hypothetical protein